MLTDLRDLRDLVVDDRPLDRLIRQANPQTAAMLDRTLAREELTVEDGTHLLTVDGDDLRALIRTADTVRAADVGDEVTYVVNRNINFTNICFVGCQFCAFARHRKDADAHSHSMEEVLAKVQQALDLGASEVCMQGGINPEMDAFTYRDLLVAIKARHPQLHVHAFSPMEIMYGARRTGMGYRDYLTMLRDAGLGTIPGTAAEILDDDIREILSHKKVDVRTWIEIVTTAHELGIRSSSTVMYGHVEKPSHIANHIALIRSLQKQTGGFTEFVPLRFIHTYTMLYQKGLVDPPPMGIVDLRVYAVSRLMLRGWIDNLQTSWVKLGIDFAQLTLLSGCNDFGGTLMEEQISKSAGADAGEYLPEDRIRALITEVGRIPVQRTTTYGRISQSGASAAGDGAGWGRRGSAVSAGPLFALDPEQLTVIVNTADDETFFGLHVSPDLDTVTYTLANRVDATQGWGVAGDSFASLAALERYYRDTWFRLGDNDLATHIYRTDQLKRGTPLSRITALIAAGNGVRARILPMSDDTVRTVVTVRGQGDLPFQDYLVKRRARGRVQAIRFRGINAARAGPGVLNAIRRADTVIIPPSNPLVSIRPILTLPGVRAALRSQRRRVAAISPLVRGQPIKGPLHRMLAGLGHEVSAVGVATLYRGLVDLFVLDQRDARLTPAIEALGMRVRVTDTIMRTPAHARALATAVLDGLRS